MVRTPTKLPSIVIARRLRRLLLLEIVLIFSLYMLLFTIVNGVLNYETTITRNLVTSFRAETIARELDSLVDDTQRAALVYRQSQTEESRLLLSESITKAVERQQALADTSDLLTATSIFEIAQITTLVNFINEDLGQYHATVNRAVASEIVAGQPVSPRASVEGLTTRYELVQQDLGNVKSLLQNKIDQTQAVLDASLSRRTALLGIQALIVMISLVAIGYGYIAPAFGKVLRRLAEQNTELRELDTMKMEFLSIASHQLKTPLSGLKWNLSLLYRHRNSMNEKDRSYLRQSKEYTDAMVRLVTNFLNVSRIEQGRMEFSIAATDVVPIIKAVVRTNSRLAKVHNINVSILTERPKMVAMVDPLLFKQVIQNLADNAVLYNIEKGSVAISVRYLTRSCVVSIEDTGVGISETDRRRLFGQFFRADTAKTLRPDGSGLGLYFVKKIIQKMDGTIRCTSHVGKGTTFTVTLPRNG